MILNCNGCEITVKRNSFSELLKEKCDFAYVITDTNVYRLYKEKIDALSAKGIYLIPSGEKSKNLKTVEKIVDGMSKAGVTRYDSILAIGGGVVSDIAGVVASNYMRGVDLYAVPTTLLSMCDASIGGKNAVDVSGAKNIFGSFYFPRKVIIDAEFLKTLPSDEYKNGMAEVAKTAFLKGEGMPSLLKSATVDTLIEQCVEFKVKTVNEDLYDNGVRKTLNFGHTLAHAIESKSRYKIKHGFAVSVGMAAAARASAVKRVCADEVCDNLIETLKSLSLPTKLPYKIKSVINEIKNDKKRNSDKISLVLLEDFGKPKIVDVGMDELPLLFGEW